MRTVPTPAGGLTKPDANSIVSGTHSLTPNPRVRNSLTRLNVILAACALVFALAACPNPETETKTVYQDYLDHITITNPTKTSYLQGTGFYRAGLVVTAHFADATTAAVSSGITLSWNNGQTITDGSSAVTGTPGSKTITVSWRGKTASFPILVVGADNTIAPITSTGEWNNAMNLIQTGGNNKSYELTIAGNFDVSPSSYSSPTFGTVNDLVVTLKGTGKLTLSGDGSIFYLQGSATAAKQKLVIDENATITLQGKSGNNAPVVYVNNYAELDMQGGEITGNTNSGDGGGVYVSSGTFTMSGGEITGNTAVSGSYGNGGGVYVYSGTFTMSGGEISGNTTGSYGSGGGVHVSGTGAAFTMSGGEISANTGYNGGGVYVSGATFAMSENGKITGNTGYGVYLYGSSTFTMSDGEISANTSSGVYVYSSDTTFTMSGGKISGNTGGVSVSGTFTMSGGEISGNTGRGVSVSGTFTMSGGEISGNTGPSSGTTTGARSGGGVYVSGTFTMSGGEISGNTASVGYGGGVYVSNSDGATFAKSGGTIYGDDDTTHTPGADENTATYGGHAVYLASTKKYDGNAGPGVKLYAKYESIWTYDGTGVPGINADTESTWE